MVLVWQRSWWSWRRCRRSSTTAGKLWSNPSIWSCSERRWTPGSRRVSPLARAVGSGWRIEPGDWCSMSRSLPWSSRCTLGKGSGAGRQATCRRRKARLWCLAAVRRTSPAWRHRHREPPSIHYVKKPFVSLLCPCYKFYYIPSGLLDKVWF